MSLHPSINTPLRVAAIDFLNPAPLMWDFEHPPLSSALAERYLVDYMQPAVCAQRLLSGNADLGLIPIASLTADLAIVPGCTIASLNEVRSILLLIKSTHTLTTIRTIAADTASRSSVAYAQVLLRKFYANEPAFLAHPADPISMLQQADAALLIGDPALRAREIQPEIEAAVGPLLWLDLAHQWCTHTGLPWVAAVWAVRPESLTIQTASQLFTDLNDSRKHGLEHIEDLVQEWLPRIDLPPDTIRRYLTQNIHYQLDNDCIRAIVSFRQYAAEVGVLAPLAELRFLEAL